MVAAGYNQKSLARAAELNETAVRDILKGRSKNPRIDTLDALAKTLRCPVSALQGNDEQSGNYDQVQRVEIFGALGIEKSAVSAAWLGDLRYSVDIPKDHRYQVVPRIELELDGRMIEQLHESHSIVMCIRVA